MTVRASDGRSHGPLVLLTAADCHLCAHARSVLAAMGDEQALEWREVPSDSEEGRRLSLAAPPFRPVLFDADGRIRAYGRLSEKRLRRALASAP